MLSLEVTLSSRILKLVETYLWPVLNPNCRSDSVWLVKLKWDRCLRSITLVVSLFNSGQVIVGKWGKGMMRMREGSADCRRRDVKRWGKKSLTVTRLRQLPIDLTWSVLLIILWPHYTDIRTKMHTRSQGSHQYSLQRNFSGSLHLVLITHRQWQLDQSDWRPPMKITSGCQHFN